MKQFLRRCACGLFGVAGMVGCLPARAQVPAWQSVLAVSTVNQASTSSAAVTATAADASGNVYLAGTLNGTIQLGGTVLISAGTDDGFVAKWNSASGTFAWAQRLGGSEMDNVRALAVVGSAVYIVGSFSSYTATFGSITLANAAGGSSDLYIAKLTDAGSSASFTWAQRAGGMGADVANALVVAGTTLYVAGSYTSAAISFGTSTLTTTGPKRAFVARFTDAGPTGSFAYAAQNGGSGTAEITGMTVGSGFLWVTGTVEGTTMYGNPVYVLASAGGTDVFVAALADAGGSLDYIQAYQGGGSQNDFGYAIAAVGSSIYLAGDFTSPAISFGTATLANTAATGSSDAFVAKLAFGLPRSSFAWLQRVGGASFEQASSLVARGTSVYVAGSFGSATATFGSLAVANSSLPGFADIFVARLLDAGSSSSFAWAQQAGGADADYGQALAASGTNLYVGGSAKLPAVFGSQTLASPGGGNPVTGFVGILADATGLAATLPVRLASVGAYPNPAHAITTLRIPAATGPATLTLLDALGRTVGTHIAPAGQSYSLDLTDLTPGVYILRVQASEAVATQKLVVE